MKSCYNSLSWQKSYSKDETSCDLRWAKLEWKYFTTGKLQGAKKNNSTIKKLLPKPITFMESARL